MTAIEECTTPALLVPASYVATLLSCSTKTVYRLADERAIPTPLRIRGMLRWNRQELEQWIEKGCPKLRR